MKLRTWVRQKIHGAPQATQQQSNSNEAPQHKQVDIGGGEEGGKIVVAVVTTKARPEVPHARLAGLPALSEARGSGARVETATRRAHLRLVPAEVITQQASPHPAMLRRAKRLRVARFRRRRIAVVVIALGIVVTANQAVGALGGSNFTQPGRLPAVTSYVAQPGDTLWSVAEQIAPGEDPRPVVDALIRARGGSDLYPGETILWQQS